MRVGAMTKAEVEEQILQALFAEAPTESPGLQLTAFGEMKGQPVRYFVYGDVLQELLKAARYHDKSATAILLGHFSMDEEGPFIEVTAFDRLSYLYGACPIELTEPALREVYARIVDDESGETQHVVGVFAARPGSMGKLDEEIARLHLSLFNMPYQVALVIDGQAERLGLFARAPKEAFFNAAFYLVEDAEEAQADEDKSPELIEQRIDDERDCRVDGAGDSRQSG